MEGIDGDMMKESHKVRSKLRTTFVIIAILIITVIVSCSITVFILKGKCANPKNSALKFPKENPQWDEVDRLDIEEKGMTISRPSSANVCYILPLRASKEEPDTPRPLVILNEPLSKDMLEHLAGEHGVTFCRGYNAYLARDLIREERRRKRDTLITDTTHSSTVLPTTRTGPSLEERAGTNIFGNSQDRGTSAENVPFDQRQPRCSDILLDCSDHVGQVQTCYTWTNGVLWMDRKCTDSKQFSIHMTKPPGRILKVAQQQWIICLQRRSQGLSC